MADLNRKHVERFEASQRAADNYLKRLGASLERLDVWVSEAPDDEHFVTGFKVVVRYGTIGDVLIVVQADSADGGVVAFHTADLVSEAIKGVMNRLDNGTLKWKEDIPYDRRNGTQG